MKKARLFVAFVLLFAMLLPGCGMGDGGTVVQDLEYVLGDTGVTVTLPSDLGFSQQASEYNDYFGIGASGEWCIIANVDEKGEYEVEEYANLTAQANNADRAYQDADGYYYFTYTNGDYRFYTAIREDDTSFYRVAFYCFSDVWNSYADRFAQWSGTIKIG